MEDKMLVKNFCYLRKKIGQAGFSDVSHKFWGFLVHKKLLASLILEKCRRGFPN